MEWVFRNPQIHSIFSNLGFLREDAYHVNDNCNATLEAILHNIITEDKYLRTFRRSISFGQNIKKDLIPLLINTKDDKTTELLIRILVNLTIPIECLLSLDVISQNDYGRHTIFEINNLLAHTKVAFTDHRATKVIIEFLKKNLDAERKSKLSAEQCTNISNSLLLLRNILHIPEDNSSQSPSYNGTVHTVQNQILWNIFSQSIDKVLIKLMTIPDATKWAVTMVQLIALLYKDQHIITLQKLLNMWLEASLSESSEDNESNTSPPDRGSENSSPILTSDATSDSSDTSKKSNDEPNSVNTGWDATSLNYKSENTNDAYQKANKKEAEKHQTRKIPHEMVKTVENVKAELHSSTGFSERGEQTQLPAKEKKTIISENSDCGYGTQFENLESISTSSNEDDVPAQKPVYKKPHNPKQRTNNKGRSGVNPQERKRKKIVKRGKATILNVQGLSHKTPTDDDISNVMKEFTVDFLLKGYNSLVQTLHSQILTNRQLEIDTSHFFWLVTYFLKFATQIELDLEHICSVLSFDILSYLTAEGVNLCEQFELTIKLDGNDLKPCMRRLHLVVTAIREFVQAIEAYKKFSHTSKDDQKELVKLQITMCETEELRSLLVLLLRHYNPKYHTKQYLQDLIVTNHILLLFLDNVMKLSDYHGSTSMLDHIKQFATPEIMYQYGLLLEDYTGNGEFVNDCIFTLMHHIGGDLDSLITLFQPKILKTFTSIWKSEFEICDEWSDLIEYVINTFIKKPHALQSRTNFRLQTENFEDNNVTPEACEEMVRQEDTEKNTPKVKKATGAKLMGKPPKEKWTEGELSSLNWNYLQCNSSPDVIGEIIKLFKEDGIIKSRDSIIMKLHHQNLINKDTFDKYIKGESERNVKAVQASKKLRYNEIGKICEQLTQDGKSEFLDWVQKVLLDTCYAKIYIEKKKNTDSNTDNTECKLLNFELFKKKSIDDPIISPVSYHSLLSSQSVPLVPWNCRQAAICKDLKFLQLLHNLGFHMPVDSGKVFIRIPNFWTKEFLYDVASKISHIEKSKLKFSINDLSDGGTTHIVNIKSEVCLMLPSDYNKDISMIETMNSPYQVQKQTHLATMINFTPMPGTSFSSNGGEIDKHNWLEVVQKSQEFKINLKMTTRSAEDVVGTADIVMQLPVTAPDTLVAPLISPLVSPLFNTNAPTTSSVDAIAAQLLVPTVMTTKPDMPIFNVNICELEYNNSVCETASVASDLTRMYVSDEEEKPEEIYRPVIKTNTHFRDNSSDCSEQERIGSRKRPRVDFSSDF